MTAGFTGYGGAFAFDDSVRESVSLDEIFSKNAYNKVFDTHPSDSNHIVHKSAGVLQLPTSNRRVNSIVNEAFSELDKHETQNHLTPEVHKEHHETILKHFQDELLDDFGFGKKGYEYLLIKEGTENVTEDIAQHKYSRLANASYDYFNSKGNAEFVHKNLMNEKYNYIKDLKDFKVDKELSTLDDLVLHNPITKESHIAYRGTTDNPFHNPKEFINDWKTNGKIAFNPKSAENTARLKNAQVLAEKTIGKYGKNLLTTSGHSQGGWVSSMIAQSKDINGFHFNPAVSMKQVLNNAKGMFKNNTGLQNIYKTHVDFASPLANLSPIKSNFNVKHVGTLKGIDKSVVSTHSIDHFAGDVVETVGESSVKVERNTMLSSIKNSGKTLGKAFGVGTQGFFTALDVKKDLKENESKTQKTKNITTDVAKGALQFAGDEVIIGAALATAPETFGASLVVGAGAILGSLAYNLATEEGAKAFKKSHAIKKATHSVESNVSKGANDVKHFFKKPVNSVTHEAKREIHSVGHTFTKAGRSIKHFFHRH